jgi:hypothetical protein
VKPGSDKVKIWLLRVRHISKILLKLDMEDLCQKLDTLLPFSPQSNFVLLCIWRFGPLSGHSLPISSVLRQECLRGEDVSLTPLPQPGGGGYLSLSGTSLKTWLRWPYKQLAAAGMALQCLGLQEAEAPKFEDSQHMKVVRLSALSTGRLYPPGKIPGTHVC